MQLKTKLVMMGDAEKPFACTHEGCGMKFVLEDHLTQHKRKHEFSLSLADPVSISKTAVLDQTPTPTTFFKNCDSVGLFQDLQHLNPFDEEFRKASNSGCNLQNADHSFDNGDSLNTPNVIPLTTERQIAPADTEVQELVFPDEDEDEDMPKTQPFSEVVLQKNVQSFPEAVSKKKVAKVIELLPKKQQDNSKETLSQPISVITHSTCIPPLVLPKKAVVNTIAPTPVVVGTQNTVANHLPTASISMKANTVQQAMTTPVTLIIKLDGQVPYVPTLATQSSLPSIAKLQPLESKASQAPATVKLKAAINSRASKAPNLSTTTIGNNNNSKNMAMVHPTLSAVLPGRRRQEDEDNPDEKRLKFLERNRAAAARCRTRRKQWVVSLQRKADELASTNELLQREVAMLRNEVAKLKTMLLAHKDCPVTLQQRAAGNHDVVSMGEQTFYPPLPTPDNSSNSPPSTAIGMQPFYQNVIASGKALENGMIFVDTVEVEISSSDSSCDGKSLTSSSTRRPLRRILGAQDKDFWGIFCV